jgi:DNA-directed RNA polymerase subunit RPC12/RpoP
MLPLAKLKPGHWYITVTCPRCNSRLPIFRDLSFGKGKLDGQYRLACPECGHADSYQPEHYFHPKPANEAAA